MSETLFWEGEMSGESGKMVCYQFYSDLGFPIFIRFNQDALSLHLSSFLEKNRFSVLPDTEAAQIDKLVDETENAKLLNIDLSSPQVAAQIRRFSETDTYGPESVTPRDGYKIYRYRNEAITIFSHRSKVWQMGVFENFGADEQAARIVINRFLAWALVPLGIISFWGVPVDEGAVVLKQSESAGECIYIDVKNYRQMSLDGIIQCKEAFQILRLDPVLKGRTIGMTKEELLSFLYQFCTYFDHGGLSYPIRQIIHHLSRLAIGQVYPEESFRPRTNLSAE